MLLLGDFVNDLKCWDQRSLFSSYYIKAEHTADPIFSPPSWRNSSDFTMSPALPKKEEAGHSLQFVALGIMDRCISTEHRKEGNVVSHDIKDTEKVWQSVSVIVNTQNLY